MSPDVRLLCVGVMAENCYIYHDRENGRSSCLIIDPGDEAQRISRELEKLELEPEAILLSHGHFDHISAVPGLREIYPGLPVYAMKQELKLLSEPGLNLSGRYTEEIRLCDVTELCDGQSLELAGLRLRAIWTPGHTAGSCCYYDEEHGILFSGDTLFCCSYGRTDLPTGSDADIIRSIRERLLVLPEEVKVYPGHEESSTIGYERRYNPLSC